MEMNSATDSVMVQYERKLDILFENLLLPGFNISNDVYFNSLLSHLAGKDNDELGKKIQSLPLLSEWLQRAISYWESNPKPTVSVSSFTIQLTALLTSNEDRFLYFESIHLYDRLCKVFCIENENNNPSIKLASIKLVAAFLDHKYGMAWLASSDHWQDCLNFCLANQTIYIIKEGHSFILKLLIKTAEVNPTLCNTIVQVICSKLHYKIDTTSQNYPEINEGMTRELTPILNLIYFILDNYFRSPQYQARDYKLPITLLKHGISDKIKELTFISQDNNLYYELNRITMAIYFLELHVKTTTEMFARIDLIDTGKNVLELINTQCNKSNIKFVMQLGYLADYFWSLLNSRIADPSSTAGQEEPLLFQNQLIVIHILPIFAVINKYATLKYYLDDHEIRDEFVSRLMTVMSMNTIRFAYTWRNMVFDQVEVFECAKMATQFCLASIKYFSHERALFFFQAFTYCLYDIIEAIKQAPVKMDIFKKQSTYLVTLFEGVVTFIQDYKFTWRESIETICITAICTDFLQCPVWPPRLVVNILKLLNVSIANFMSPSLALLVEPGENDIAAKHLGTTLQNKLCDIDWEVRDSALEVIHTIANIADTKYPSFQKLLLDLDLVRLVAGMSSSDSESYVRASAIKCIQQMIKVDVFWKKVLRNEKLTHNMITVLQHEQEGLVRSEAAVLMSLLYYNQLIPSDALTNVYQAMYEAVISDLHWEVKSNALDFWAKVILNHLADQGFIDGSFPTITFSKENKKIVTLTEAEIQIRIIKVLKKLGQNGCLAVFMCAMQDDCDIEVAKKALSKLKKVQSLFQTHHLTRIEYSDSMPSTPTSVSSPTPPDSGMGQSPMSQFPINSPPKVDQMIEDVIEGIINSSDISLVREMYTPNGDNLINECEFSNTGSSKKVVTIKTVSPEEFLTFTQQNLDAIVEEKQCWLNKVDNFNSLLDDIITTCDTNINRMDCY